MRLLNPYAKQQTSPVSKSIPEVLPAEIKSEPEVTPKKEDVVKEIENTARAPVKEEVKTIAKEDVKVPVKAPAKEEVKAPVKDVKEYKTIHYGKKSFDHLHSQELIDKTRSLKKKLFPIDFTIPREFQNLQNCLNSDGDCGYEIASILSK